jgi:hypothetical protein
MLGWLKVYEFRLPKFIHVPVLEYSWGNLPTWNAAGSYHKSRDHNSLIKSLQKILFEGENDSDNLRLIIVFSDGYEILLLRSSFEVWVIITNQLVHCQYRACFAWVCCLRCSSYSQRELKDRMRFDAVARYVALFQRQVTTLFHEVSPFLTPQKESMDASFLRGAAANNGNMDHASAHAPLTRHRSMPAVVALACSTLESCGWSFLQRATIYRMNARSNTCEHKCVRNPPRNYFTQGWKCGQCPLS